MKKELPINSEGKKMYPVCSWDKNQHKLYNAHDRAMLAVYDGTGTWEQVQRIEDALHAFDSHVIEGIVYATWEDSQLIKDYVWAYNARH